jgi:hypothetical protein
MTTENLACPYCNASINVRPGTTAGQRIVCPRCGDAFALRPLDTFTESPRTPLPAETGITAAAPAAGPPFPVAPADPRSRRSIWLVGGAVVAVMLVMAGVGLAFMLMTQDQRRAHDTSRPPRRPGRQPGVPEPDIVRPAPVSPDKLAALSYLPPGANFLVGARIAELLDNPIGTRLLRDPIKLGTSEYRLETLPGWVGLRLEDIDHLVFAAKVDDAVVPPFYLVLRTASPYDEEQLRQRLKASRAAGVGKKKVYACRIPKIDFPSNVWFADERTLVLAMFADQLEPLPDRPTEDLGQLPDRVREVLQKRREPVAPAWIVGHSRDWTRTTAAKFLGQMKKEDRERWAALRSFGIWLVPERALGVKGVFECKDTAAASGLDHYFRSLRGDDPTFKTALDGSWLTLQFQAPPDLSRLAPWAISSRPSRAKTPERDGRKD